MKQKLVIWVLLRNVLLISMLLGIFYLPLINQPRIANIVILPIAGMILFLSGIAFVIVSSHKLIRVAEFYGNKLQIDPTPEKLVTTGLYKIVRHPLYVGCIITLFGWCLFWRSFYCLYFLIPIFIIGLIIKAFQEERDLEKVFGDDYRKYRKKVGMFLPKLRKKK